MEDPGGNVICFTEAVIGTRGQTNNSRNKREYVGILPLIN